MTKSPKNRRPRRSRSRSPQVNDGVQRTPTNPAQRVIADAASALSTGVRRVFDSGTKIMSRRNKNQDTSATVQQGDASMVAQQDTASMMVNTPSVNTPDGSNTKNNTTQECGVMDSDTSFLSEFGARASQVEVNNTIEFSPISNQVASPVQSVDASKFNLGAPPRPNSSRDNVTVTGMDLLATQNTTTSNDSVAGTHVPAPSLRRSTQSPATHQLQQTLRNNASEQVRRCDSSSPAQSNDDRDGASAFSAVNANNCPTIVETVQEGILDDGDEGLASDLADCDAQVACDSGLQTFVVNTAGNLVIDANDPGREDFVTSVGALGNASGAPVDGTFFGEDVAEERRIDDSAAKSAASRNSWFNRMGNRSGVKADSGSESNASCDAVSNQTSIRVILRHLRISSLNLLSQALTLLHRHSSMSKQW